MRRSLLPLLVILSACATTPIVLEPAFPVGTQRVYLLTVDALTEIDVAGAEAIERSRFTARSTLDLLGRVGGQTRAMLTVEPLAAERNGVPEDLPTQQVVLLLSAAGGVEGIEDIGGVPADVTGAVEDLAPMLGIALPQGRVQIGERWRASLDGGDQSGRVQALRIVDGREAAILTVGTTRTLRRARTIGDQTLALTGTEFSTAQVSFALIDRLPISIESNAEGRFGLEGLGPEAGAILTRSTTTLTLESVGPRSAGQ